MMKTLMILSALVLVGGAALAGVNQGGRLLVHNPGIAFTSDITEYCGMSPLAVCEQTVARIDGPGAWVWKVYAAFPGTAVPHLAGLNFGVFYDKADPTATPPDYNGLLILDFKMCGDFELTTAGWPGPNEGTGMVWNIAQLGNPIECYWFAGYNYSETYTGTPVPELFALGPHPTQGGIFADDSVPSIVDTIVQFGALGFDQDGVGCEWAVPEGLCCDPVTGLCTLRIPAECLAPLVWLPGVTCDPNPCPPPVPTETTTWGQIKATYR